MAYDLHLAEQFRATSRRFPDKPALQGAGRALTYGALATASTQIANALRRDGVLPGDRVVLAFRNDPSFIEAYLGCAIANVVPVAFYPDYGPAALDAVASQAGAVSILCDGSPRTHAVVVRARASVSRRIAFVDRAEPAPSGCRTAAHWLDGASTNAVSSADNPDDVLVILCSSGTTGAIKLVPRTHRAFLAASRRFGDLWGCGPEARFGVASLITHAAALGWGVHPVLLAGGTLVVEPDRRPAALLSHFERHRVTDTFLVPGQARELVRVPMPSNVRLALDLVVLGGESLDSDLASALSRRFRCELLNTYGMSEGFCTATVRGDLEAILAGSVGRPCFAEDELRILDAYGGAVADGAVGELWVRGPACVRACWSAASADAFSTDGFFRTGDLVRVLGDGSLAVVGRTKLVINRDGIKVSPEALEMSIRRLVGVAGVVVVPLRDAGRGERICAVVEMQPAHAAPTLEWLHRGLLDLGAGRTSLPDRLHVVRALPLGPTGKLDRGLASSLAETGASIQ